MVINNSQSRYGRNIYLLKRLRTILTVSVIIAAVVISVLIIYYLRSGYSNEKQAILQSWNKGEYDLVYNISGNALLKKPIDYFFLSMKGFSSYQLGISQINNQNMLVFIDECIFSLRKAMILASAKNDARIFYVLGKAYGHKGTEYADLAIKYLSLAEDMSYNASDIHEYLGIAYAATGDYRASVAAFTKSLDLNNAPADGLLLSIARSYISLEEYNTAQGYLVRCIDSSADSRSIILARFMLAEIYAKTRDYENAEKQYLTILSESGQNAEAHFRLGELFMIKRDASLDTREKLDLYTRARSEWRAAYRLDPAHAGARARLNI